MKTRRLLLLLAFFLALSGAGKEASALSLLVKPMTLELAGQPGSTVTATLEVRNTDSAEPQLAEIVSRELLQSADGGWTYDKPNDKPTAHSSLSWLTVSQPSMQIPPLTTTPLDITIRIPRNARGSYYAALLVRNVPKSQRGIPIVMQFLVPVLIEVGGRTNPSIAIEALGLDETTNEEGKNVLCAWGSIHNTGGSIATIGGHIDIFHQHGERWRRIESVEVMERRILPDATITRVGELKRHLPSGEYQLRSRLTMNGRNIRPMKTLCALGTESGGAPDPGKAALNISPEIVTIKTSPGSLRSGSMNVINNGITPVTVSFTPKPHPAFSNTNQNYDCSDWIEVKPEKLTLRAGQSRPARLMLKRPDGETTQPYHYGTVTATAFIDGKASGSWDVLIASETPRQKAAATLAISRPKIRRQQNGAYTVLSSIRNTGNKHCQPETRARIADTTGMKTIRTLQLKTKDAPLLPGESHAVAAEFTPAGIADGNYSLEIITSYGDKQESASIPIRIHGGALSAITTTACGGDTL